MECHWVRHGVNGERPRATPVGENADIRLIQVTTSPLTQNNLPFLSTNRCERSRRQPDACQCHGQCSDAPGAVLKVICR